MTSVLLVTRRTQECSAPNAGSCRDSLWTWARRPRTAGSLRNPVAVANGMIQLWYSSRGAWHDECLGRTMSCPLEPGLLK